MKIRITGFLITISLLTSTSAFAICGAETRKTIDSLKCTDLSDNSWYEIKVNSMCGTKNGEEQQTLEFEELRPNFKNTQARVYANEQAYLIANNLKEGSKEWQLFDQRAGKSGSIKAFAVASADNKTIEKARLEITPNKGDVCSKVVDVTSAWKKA